jgi:hypothetical protein
MITTTGHDLPDRYTTCFYLNGKLFGFFTLWSAHASIKKRSR